MLGSRFAQLARNMIENSMEDHVLVGGLFVVETGVLKDDAEAFPRLFLAGARIETIELDASAGRLAGAW